MSLIIDDNFSSYTTGATTYGSWYDANGGGTSGGTVVAGSGGLINNPAQPDNNFTPADGHIESAHGIHRRLRQIATRRHRAVGPLVDRLGARTVRGSRLRRNVFDVAQVVGGVAPWRSRAPG